MFLSPGSRARPRPAAQMIATGVTPSGRLTLTSGTPVTTTDVAAATSIYYTPYNGQEIELFNGHYWSFYTFSEIRLSISGFAASTVFDVFARPVGASAIAIDTTAWTNDTTRAVSITTINGVDVKSNDFTRRLIGTFRTTTSAGQTEDSITRRYLSNRYNDVLRPMQVNDATATWTYSTATWRQANGNTANQLDCVCTVARPVQVIAAGCTVTSSGNASVASGVGVDSVPAASNAVISQQASINTAGSFNSIAYYAGTPGVGRHFFTWLEYGQAGVGTQTWLGTVLPWVQSGIVGTVSA